MNNNNNCFSRGAFLYDVTKEYDSDEKLRRYEFQNDPRWESDHLFKCVKLWTEKTGFWPEPEASQYACEIIANNYPIYEECFREKTNNCFSWRLKLKDYKCSTDIMTSTSIFSLKRILTMSFYENKNACSDYIDAFLKVLYTIGNMTTVDSGRIGGPGSYDAWDQKLHKIQLNIFQDKGACKLGTVFREYYCDSGISEPTLMWKQYIADHYMIDYLDSCMNVRSIATLNKYTDSDSRETSLSDYLSHLTKLIIQRGYRIKECFKDYWDRNHAEEVCKAFKAVGLPPDPDEAHGLPYTVIGEWEE